MTEQQLLFFFIYFFKGAYTLSNYSVVSRKQDGFQYYHAINQQGKEEAYLLLGDGKLEGYSIVPEIKKLVGNEDAVLTLVSWLVARLKSPVVCQLRSRILHEFGFVYIDQQLVWEPSYIHQKPPLELYEVWVESQTDARPFRLEVKARGPEDAKFVVGLNFPRVHIGYTNKVCEQVANI